MKQETSSANPWRLRITLLSGVHAVGTACYLSIMAMGPLIRDSFAISNAQFGLFMSAVFGVQMVSALPSGWITDRFGVGWTLFGAMVFCAFGSILFALSGTFEAAFIGALFIGLGYSLVNPATGKAVVRWFPAEWRATAMGVKQLGVPVGGVIGAAGGVAAAYLDWRPIVTAAAVLSLVTAFMWVPFMRRPVAEEGGILAVYRDLRSIIVNKNMNVICFACVMFNAGQSSLFAYMALFLRDAALASQPIAALGVAFAQGASAIGRVGYSYLSDTLLKGRRKRLVVGLIVASFLACGLAYWVSPAWPHWGLMIVAVIMGGTIASYAALMLTLTAETIEPRLIGSALGYNGIAWSLGGMTGPPLFGAILDATSNNYGIAWISVGAIMLLGAIALGLFFTERDR